MLLLVFLYLAESVKGTKEIQKAWHICNEYKERLPFSFQGNVEGKEVFLSDLDVLVTSGFVGNVFLKTAEGISAYFLDAITKKNIPGFSSKESDRLSIANYFTQKKSQGAFLAGIDQLVFKCHSRATISAIEGAIKSAYRAHQAKVLPQMQRYLEKQQPLLSELCQRVLS